MKRLAQLFFLILENDRILQSVTEDSVIVIIEGKTIEIKRSGSFDHRKVEVCINGYCVYYITDILASNRDFKEVSNFFKEAARRFQNRQDKERYENTVWFERYFSEKIVYN